MLAISKRVMESRFVKDTGKLFNQNIFQSVLEVKFFFLTRISTGLLIIVIMLYSTLLNLIVHN